MKQAFKSSGGIYCNYCKSLKLDVCSFIPEEYSKGRVLSLLAATFLFPFSSLSCLLNKNFYLQRDMMMALTDKSFKNCSSVRKCWLSLVLKSVTRRTLLCFFLPENFAHLFPHELLSLFLSCWHSSSLSMWALPPFFCSSVFLDLSVLLMPPYYGFHFLFLFFFSEIILTSFLITVVSS